MDVATPGQKARFFAKGLPQSWIDGQWQLQRGILKQVYCLPCAVQLLCCCCAAAVVCPALRPYAPLSPLLPACPCPPCPLPVCPACCPCCRLSCTYVEIT